MCNICFFRSAKNAYYKVLLANAATSALRLHQRLPRLSFTREYVALLLVEDSCHYLFFSIIFLYVSPFILILLPVVLFAVLHAASYSLTLLDVSICTLYACAHLCVQNNNNYLFAIFSSSFFRFIDIRSKFMVGCSPINLIG